MLEFLDSVLAGGISLPATAIEYWVNRTQNYPVQQFLYSLMMLRCGNHAESYAALKTPYSYLFNRPDPRFQLGRAADRVTALGLALGEISISVSGGVASAVAVGTGVGVPLAVIGAVGVKEAADHLVLSAMAGNLPGGDGGNGGSGDATSPEEDTASTGRWKSLGSGRPPAWGDELAELADDVYLNIEFWPRRHSTIAVSKVGNQVYVTHAGDPRAGQQLAEIANVRGYTYLPNVAGEHAEVFLYNQLHNKPGFLGIGVSHVGGPCETCRVFFDAVDFTNVFWTGLFK